MASIPLLGNPLLKASKEKREARIPTLNVVTVFGKVNFKRNSPLQICLLGLSQTKLSKASSSSSV